MRRPRTLGAFAAGALALAVVLAPVAGSQPVSTAEAADITWFEDSFEDGSVTPFVAVPGSVSATVVDTDAQDGSHALSVSGRTDGWHSVRLDLLAAGLEPGTYEISAWVKLAADAPADTTGVNFTVDQVPSSDDADNYKLVGEWGKTVGKTDWVEIGGAYTLTDTRTTAELYVDVQGIRVDAETTVHPGFLLDNVVITAPDATPSIVDIWSLDFDDESVAPWSPNPPSAISFVDDGVGGKALAVTRSQDYHGIDSPSDALRPGTTYTASFRARLPEGATGTQQVRLVMKSTTTGEPRFDWIGDTEIDADDWTDVVGVPFTVPAEALSAMLYIGSGGSGSYTFYVDDLVITGPAAPADTWTPDLTGFVPGGAVGATTTPVNAARGTGKVAALTFDDGPSADTAAMLDVLAENGVKATFCLIGSQINETTAPIVRRIVLEGHSLCAHSTGWSSMDTMTRDAIQADLKANLAAIRNAVGNPNQKVPYFRAPNVAWGDGRVAQVAAALGMQPIGLGNPIMDWDDPSNDLSEGALTTNLRNAITPGAIVTAHVGGGSRVNTVKAAATVIPEKLAEGYTFTLPMGGLPEGLNLAWDFEDGELNGWGPRASGGSPTVTVTDAEAHESTRAALVSNRAGQGDGMGLDASGIFQAGVTYEISAWVKMADGEAADDIWLSAHRRNGSADSFDTVGQFAGVGSSGWRQVTATYTPSGFDSVLLYFETSYDSGGPGSFLVDDITITSQAPMDVQPLEPIKDTVDFPAGVAIDTRETIGSSAELTLRHFNQITPENHMKVEAWYDEATRAFRMHPEAAALLDFAEAEALRVYGHVLVWHSQTPDWFFQDENGEFLTRADYDEMRDRLETHIKNVAESIYDEYGPFGSDTNPMVAWDVVNEVVSDQASVEQNGLRNSHWYRIMGEDFIDLAFEYADHYFNDVYAAEGSDRPIKLFINDYNTEQSGKQDRYFALVSRLLERGVPIDGVGHQFHVSLSMPVENLAGALDRFSELPVIQAVTELDVTVGTPNEASVIEQGYYYRDAFRAFRAFHEETGDLFSATIWGLTDSRSWRSEQAPLAFTGQLQAKPAYYGIVDAELPARIRTANVFAGDLAVNTAATGSLEWKKLPLHTIEDVATFQLRWAADHLTAYVSVDDATVERADAVEFEYGGEVYTFGRDGSGDVDGVAVERSGGYDVVVHLPGEFAQGTTVAFDVRVVDGDTTSGWNTPGALGTLSLIEALSYVAVAEAPEAPEIDGEIDDVWELSQVLTTDKRTTGVSEGAAKAEVRTLWTDDGSTLYVLMDVTDPELNADASDPWEQDSVEIYVDRGNYKNGSYRYDDNQIRIDFEGDISFGTGDEAFQRGSVDYAVALREGGYVVEVAIDLLENYGGPGTFHGLDFQVNDASTGAPRNIHNWADPTGNGYQSTARWGVGRLVPSTVDGPVVTLGLGEVKAGGSVPVALDGFEPGQTVELFLSQTGPGTAAVTLAAAAGDVLLTRLVVDGNGSATGLVTVPATTAAGTYWVNAELNGSVIVGAQLRVLAADGSGSGGDTGGTGGSTGGFLPKTGSQALGLLLTALLLLGLGAGLVAARRPARKGAAR